MHTGDTVQEKLSLVARFGVTIYFGAPDKKQFQQIVEELADRHQIQEEKTNMLQRVMATWVVTTKRNILMMANR